MALSKPGDGTLRHPSPPTFGKVCSIVLLVGVCFIVNGEIFGSFSFSTPDFSTNTEASAAVKRNSSSHEDIFTLEKLEQERRKRECKWKEVKNKNEVAYLCVARSASATVQEIVQQIEGVEAEEVLHDHNCRLETLEEGGARKVLVVLRHPLARISSGLARRFEGFSLDKYGNKILYENFESAEDYISALRNVTNDRHSAAMKTLKWSGQNYLTPVTEFYLKGSLGEAELAFLCIDSLIDDAIHALDEWNLEHSVKSLIKESNLETQHHQSKLFSSSNLTNVFSRFSQESIAWVEKIYAADIQLFESHCGKTIK